jgi:lysylphosphatidylglycerol synthetase-like protein (DUF2156 family)
MTAMDALNPLAQPRPAPAPRASSSAVEHALRRWGRTALSFDTLQCSERYQFFESREVPGALVPYRSVGGSDVVIGEPLAPEDGMAAVVREFLEARRRSRRLVLGFLASEAFARAAVAAGASAAQLTAEPEIDPATYEPTGGSAKKFRVYVRRLRRQGIEASSLPSRTARVPEEFRSAAEALVQRWMARGVARGAHLLEVDAWRLAQEKRYFAVFDPKAPERMWSLLIAHPVYGLDGWHLCHIVRDPDAPKGVAELAVWHAIETFGEEGVRYATFGPFADPRPGEFVGMGRVARGFWGRAYNAASVFGGYANSIEFYRKVQAGPWRPRWMIFYPRRKVMRNFVAAMRVTHVLGFLDRG